MLQTEKQQLRRYYREARRTLSSDEKRFIDCKISDNLLKSDLYRDAACIFCYVSTSDEIGTAAILKQAQELGYAEADPSADIDGDDIRRKLRRAVTDSDGEIRVDAENKPGVTNLITICAAMSNRTPEQVCQDLAGQGYGALKDAAAEAVIATLAPIQAEHKRIMADKAYIADVLKDGAERASVIAFKTLRKVYKKVGLYQG